MEAEDGNEDEGVDDDVVKAEEASTARRFDGNCSADDIQRFLITSNPRYP